MMKHLPEHTRRTAQLVNRPGGMTVQDAVSAAEQSIAGLRDRGLADMAQTICGMQAIAVEIGPDGDDERANELYRESNSLIGVAGVFSRAGLGDVAMSLCTLIERLLLARQWDATAVKLHLDSLRLLSGEGISPAQMSVIGTALRQVVDRLQPATMPARLS